MILCKCTPYGGKASLNLPPFTTISRFSSMTVAVAVAGKSRNVNVAVDAVPRIEVANT